MTDTFSDKSKKCMKYFENQRQITEIINFENQDELLFIVIILFDIECLISIKKSTNRWYVILETVIRVIDV